MADQRIIKDLYKSPFYRVWADMKTRCYNPNNNRFYRYADKEVCAKWLDFDGFYIDMYGSYQPGLSIDRIDNDKGYYPENCRWATAKQQANNRSTNRLLSYAGQTKTVSEWADFLGIKYSTFKQRYYVYKWPLDRLIGGYLG